MAEDDPESPQRWTAKRRATLILSILKGETSAQAAARKHGLTVAEVEEWRDRFLLGAENALRARPKDEDARKDEQIKKLQQKGGELVLDLHILKEASTDPPFAPKPAAGAGSDQPGRPQRRAVGDRPGPCVLWPRRLGPSRRGDRLPRPGAHRPRVRPARAGEGGRAGARGGLSGTVRHPAPWRRYAGRPLRQRPDLSESTLSRGVSRLPAYAGVHHTVYAPAEWNHRALLPQLEGGMRLAAQLRQLRTRPARAECVDPLVQRGAPAPGAGLSEPARLPGARSRSGGLILGEHYKLAARIRIRG